MFHLEILIIVVAVIICGCNTLIIIGLRRCDDSGGGHSALLPAPDSKRQQQFFLFHALAIALAVSGARSPFNPGRAFGHPSSTLPLEQQYHFMFEQQQIIVFLGRAECGAEDTGGDNGAGAWGAAAGKIL